MVILDTDIIIDHLRQPPEKSLITRLLQRVSQKQVKISLVTIQELYAGRSTRDPQREKDLLTTITLFDILPYTYEIAKLAGELRRDLSRPLNFSDAAIAATAILNHYQLFTLNKKDFVGIPDITLYQLN